MEEEIKYQLKQFLLTQEVELIQFIDQKDIEVKSISANSLNFFVFYTQRAKGKEQGARRKTNTGL